MEFPDKIKQTNYRSMFVCSITSALDGTTTFSSFGKSWKDRKLEEDDPTAEETEADKLRFDLEVTKHDAREIKI